MRNKFLIISWGYCCCCYCSATEVLIPIVMNLDLTDRSGKTALHHAAFNGHLEMLSLLQLKGASVKAMDRKDRTPLHCAAFMGE